MDVYGCYEENDESRIVMQPAEILFVLEAVHDVLRLMILHLMYVQPYVSADWRRTDSAGQRLELKLSSGRASCLA